MRLWRELRPTRHEPTSADRAGIRAQRGRQSRRQACSPKNSARTWAPREQSVQQLAENVPPAPGLVRNQPQQREEAPLVKARHGKSAERAAAAPQGIEPQVYAESAHRDDFPLQKGFRALRKRGEKICDDGRGGGQDGRTLERARCDGQAHCAIFARVDETRCLPSGPARTGCKQWITPRVVFPQFHQLANHASGMTPADASGRNVRMRWTEPPAAPGLTGGKARRFSLACGTSLPRSTRSSISRVGSSS